MTKIRNLTQRFAIPFAVIFTVAAYWLMIGISELTGQLTNSRLIFELVQMTWPILLAIALGYGYICTMKGFGKTLKAGCLYLGFYLLLAIITVFTVEEGTRWESTSNILLGILAMIGIGIREEFQFRGIIGNALALKYMKTTKGLWLTLIVSSLLFGFVHMFNILAGVTLKGAFLQSLGAAGVGLITMAIYLRGGNIWLVALIHAVIDFVGLFDSTFIISEVTETDQMSNLSSIGPLVTIPAGILIAMFLFRKSKRQEVFDHFDALRAKFG